MVGLGDAQVKIPPQVLHGRIVVGVNHRAVAHVGDGIAGLHRPRREDHVLIENRAADEAAQPLEHLPAVGRADVRAEIGLDAELP